MFSLKRIMDTYRNKSFPGFLRFLLQLEREKRLNFLYKIHSLYNKQILLSYCTHAGSSLKVGPNELTLKIRGNVSLTFGSNIQIFTPIHISLTSYFCSHARLTIGDGTHIGPGTAIRVAKAVDIGKNCLIARSVRIFDHNGHPLEPAMRLARKKIPDKEIRPIVIGDNVWIGENAFINAGVNIGSNSIVSANSLVTKDVPENVIVLGNPARPTYWFNRSKNSEPRLPAKSIS